MLIYFLKGKLPWTKMVAALTNQSALSEIEANSILEPRSSGDSKSSSLDPKDIKNTSLSKEVTSEDTSNLKTLKANK